MTASASRRRLETGRPSVEATIATPDIASARSTDGSQRVTNPKRTSTATPAASRPPRLIRPSNGDVSARTNATFCPDTTRRWVSPEARKSSTVSTDCARSSPSTKPANRARRSSGSDAAPATSVRRTPFASRLTGPPNAHEPTSSMLSRAPTCRRASRSRAAGGTGSSRPAREMRSPAKRSRRRPAAPPRAHASTRPCPRRRSTRTAPSKSSGSLTSVATPDHPRGDAGRTPAHARAEQPDDNSAAPRQSRTGDRRANASATTISATGNGTGTATSAPPAVDSASTMAAPSLTR